MITELAPYSDERGNVIECRPRRSARAAITFQGSNNRLVIRRGSKIAGLTVEFYGDGALVEIGHNRETGKPALHLRLGGGSTIRIGDNLSTTTTLFASAVEGATIRIKDDVMAASHVSLRTDDSHGIYDVMSGARINPARDITIGQHVWLGYDSVVFGGVRIRSGSVLGMRSIATSNIPNNCIAVGSPAKVVRRNIAWERPYLWLSDGPADWAGHDPAELPSYWKLSPEPKQSAPAPPPSRIRRIAAVLRRFRG